MVTTRRSVLDALYGGSMSITPHSTLGVGVLVADICYVRSVRYQTRTPSRVDTRRAGNAIFQQIRLQSRKSAACHPNANTSDRCIYSRCKAVKLPASSFRGKATKLCKFVVNELNSVALVVVVGGSFASMNSTFCFTV